MSEEIPEEIAWSLPPDMREAPSRAPDLHRAPRKAKSNNPSSGELLRVPPNSIEAEQGALGCCLLEPQTCIGVCIEQIKPEVFYDLRHRDIYETLVAMTNEGCGLDLITIQQRLRDQSKLDSVGGLAYLSGLPDTIPSAANLQFYIDILRDKYTQRMVIATGTEMVQRGYEATEDVGELVDSCEKAVMEISQDREAKKGQEGIRDLVKKAIGNIQLLHESQGKILGIETGFADFDKMTNGLQNGEMIVIAGRPSAGKSSWSMNVVEHAAINNKIPTGVFSLEMTAGSLVQRILCGRSKVNLRGLRDGVLTQGDFDRMSRETIPIMKAPLYIDDSAGLSVMQLRAKARRMHQQYGIKLMMIDYLQMLHSDNRKVESTQQEVADISNGIKSLAKELNIPIIALSQMNREMEKDKKRKPRLADLRSSGAIEQDADLVAFLYKPNQSDEDDDISASVIPVNLLLAKNRNGPIGDVPLTFFKSYTRFESAAKISAEDMPDYDKD